MRKVRIPLRLQKGILEQGFFSLGQKDALGLKPGTVVGLQHPICYDDGPCWAQVRVTRVDEPFEGFVDVHFEEVRCA